MSFQGQYTPTPPSNPSRRSRMWRRLADSWFFQ